MAITSADPIVNANSEAANKTGKAVEQIARSGVDALQKTAQAANPTAWSGTDFAGKLGNAAEKIATENVDALGRSGASAVSGFQEMTKAYQEIMTNNLERLQAAVQAMVAVRSPTELMELQRRLVTEGMDAAVGDFNRITSLTVAVFMASLKPLQEQTATMQDRLNK